MTTPDAPQTTPTETASTPISSTSSAADTAQRTLAAARKLGNPLLLAALLVAGLSSWQWYDARQQAAQQKMLEKRLNDADSGDRESRALLKQSQEQNTALMARLSQLEERLDQFSEQTGGLQSVYRDLSVNRDVAVLTEIEHALTLSAQQLQNTGNLAAAISAVQAADQRLVRLDRPHFAPVRKALVSDLERLRNTPIIDIAGISQRLESVIIGIDQLPLAMDARPKPIKTDNKTTAEESALDKLTGSIWSELRNLIRIERIDTPSPVLLPADQQFFVRENIKLRLLSARLSLMARDANSFKHELQAARELLERHFNPQDKRVEHALSSLKQFASTPLNTDLPSLQNSLSALRQAQQATEKKAKP